MASNYTCRACSRALSRCSSSILGAAQKGKSVRSPQSYRELSTSAPQLYHATTSLSAVTKADARKSNGRSTVIDPAKYPMTGIAAKFREKAPLMMETYVAYGATQKLVAECARPGDYKIPQALENGGEIPTNEKGAHLGEGTGWWYETLGLAPTFINWAQITFIHMYLLQVRFRMFPESHASVWIQHLTNHAFYAAEDRLVFWHKLNSTSLRQKYLKDMFSQWRAVLLSYDEGLVKGDAVLAAAVWRNLFGAKEDVDFQKLAQIVGYMRRELRRLDAASHEEVANGQWTFTGNPGQDEKVVLARSKLASEAPRA